MTAKHQACSRKEYCPLINEKQKLPDQAYLCRHSGSSDFILNKMPAMGVEPIRCCHHRILNPARLPIPSRRLR
jgi:hypothetical protein